jgi:hypothetical protein
MVDGRGGWGQTIRGISHGNAKMRGGRGLPLLEHELELFLQFPRGTRGFMFKFIFMFQVGEGPLPT